MKKIIIIPARFQSKRFPGKPLKKILNKELVIWVAEASDKVLGNEFVYIATDDERIDNKVKEYGFKTILTSKDCLTGTDRVAEASLKIESDIYKVLNSFNNNLPSSLAHGCFKFLLWSKLFSSWLIL